MWPPSTTRCSRFTLPVETFTGPNDIYSIPDFSKECKTYCAHLARAAAQRPHWKPAAQRFKSFLKKRLTTVIETCIVET